MQEWNGDKPILERIEFNPDLERKLDQYLTKGYFIDKNKKKYIFKNKLNDIKIISEDLIHFLGLKDNFTKEDLRNADGFIEISEDIYANVGYLSLCKYSKGQVYQVAYYTKKKNSLFYNTLDEFGDYEIETNFKVIQKILDHHQNNRLKRIDSIEKMNITELLTLTNSLKNKNGIDIIHKRIGKNKTPYIGFWSDNREYINLIDEKRNIQYQLNKRLENILKREIKKNNNSEKEIKNEELAEFLTTFLGYLGENGMRYKTNNQTGEIKILDYNPGLKL